MNKGLNIVSRLTFENIPDGTLPTYIPDENQYSNYSYTRYAGTVSVNVETVNGIKFIKLASATSNSKIYAQNVINDQSKKNFQAEFDVIFDSISTEMTLAAIGSSNALTTMLRVVAYADPTKGIALVNDIRSINSYYKFETNKKYTICIGMKDNVISMYIDGTIIGYSYSEEFTNNLNVVTPASIILGSTALINHGATGGMLTGKLGNINISSGPSVKHEESYTKYGTNLVSFLNFENLAGIGTYKTGVEAVYEGIEWRGVESATYSNRYGNIKNISTDLTGEFTVTFSLKKFKVANANILKYGNYSVDYVAGFIPVPEPDVEVNEYTTSALNFENGLVDQIDTTVWTKEGTADITSVNKIFGENSFETKALADSLYTNSNVITGGSTPFTIEFYALIKNRMGPTWSGYVEAPLYSKNGESSNQRLLVNFAIGGKLQYSGFSNDSLSGSYNILMNEINKFAISYDGQAYRVFINDRLDYVCGTNQGLNINHNMPFTFFDSLVPVYAGNRISSVGIIDNINIHDGIATKVRDPDPYEEFLVVDLAFDGENNSTRIVDNGTAKLTWTTNGTAKLSTDQKFDGFSSLKISDLTAYIKSDNNILNFNTEDSYTIKFDFIINNDTYYHIFLANSASSQEDISMIFYNPVTKSISIRALNSTNSVDQFQLTEIIKPNMLYNFTMIYDKGSYSFYINNRLNLNVTSIKKFDFTKSGTIIGQYYNSSATIFLDGYIKNFKIYKGVAVIPEDPTGKIQLDFDDNVIDKYGNSTWTNNGVTFDQVNSVKGHAAYFNSNSKITNTDNKFNANRSDFILSLDMMPKSGRGQYAEFIASSETTYPVEGSSYISCFDDGLIRTASYLNGVDTSFGSFNIKDDIYYKIDIIRKNGIMYHVLNDVYQESCNLDTISSYSNLPKFNFNVIGKVGWNANNIGYKGYLDNVRLVKSNILNKFIVASNNNDSHYICSYSNKSFGFKDTKANASTKYYLAECPKLTDFIIETDFYYNSNSQLAIIFNGESFIDSNLVNAWGNIIYFENGSFGFGYGTGPNFGSIVSPQAHGIEYKSDARLKIIKNGLNVKLYINDILKLDTNCYYNDRSYIGIRTYSVSTTNVSEINMFRNFTVKDVLDESIIYELNDNEQTIDINNNNNNINIHIPFEGSTSNIGYNNVNVITSGNPIYSNEYKAIKIENNKYVYIQHKNIFNVGSNHDFFIGMEIMIISMKNYNFILCNHNSYNNNLLFDMYIDSNGRINIRSGSSSPYYTHQNELTINHFYSIALIRDKSNFYLSIDGELTKIQNKHINFSQINLYIGASGWLGSTDFLNGYIRNFKFNLGSSIIPEAYNQHTVLDLDFKPTRKSYLFKDNNNKCVIHPVNITQRDYQDSQYCCTFNGTNQHLQLGKNDLLNFGFDDCVIEIVFEPKTQSAEWGTLIGHSMPSAASMDFLMVTRDGTIACRVNNLGLTINTNIKVVYNEINKLLFIRNSKNITIKLNDVVIYDEICGELFNLNKNDNTYIGRNGWDDANGYFCGTIYSIKVLRNTTDLYLLENENVDVIAGDTTLTLSNGTDSQEVIFNNKNQNDFRFVHSNDSTKLITNEQILEVPNVENELNELSLFTDFNAEAKDIKTYNIAFEDEDTFSGNIPIHTQFGEIEEISTLSDEFIVVDQGDFIVKGFFEGRPEDSRYQIQNRFDKFIVHTGSGPFNYNGLNERYIDDYEIYLPVTKESMPIPTEPMIRGYITVSITPTECEGINFGVKVFRRSDNKLIGIYDFNNYICTIDNLDCNKRYDCIIFDQDVNLESRCLSNRTPIPY